MEWDFSAEELRVLGCLVEKRLSTPAHYPLSLNALVNACNQTSNRDPVVSYDQKVVNEALISTRKKGYSLICTRAGARVPKFKELLSEKLDWNDAQAAVMAELILRGPQTCGELRQRCSRMFKFGSLGEVEGVVAGLEEKGVVTRLPRKPGKREVRFAHLLGSLSENEVQPQSLREVGAPGSTSFKSGVDTEGGSEISSSYADLEARVKVLEDQVARLWELLKTDSACD